MGTSLRRKTLLLSLPEGETAALNENAVNAVELLNARICNEKKHFSTKELDMPLVKSKSKAAFRKNVAAEVNAGKPTDQAVAIAYAVQRKAEGKTAAKPKSAKKK